MKDCPAEVLTKRGNIKYLDSLRELARGNRKNQTDSEKLVWDNILRKKQTGFIFLRQKPISRFVLDFYCSKLLLAIEVDGRNHLKKLYVDRERDSYLENYGIKTVRIDADLVMNNFLEVKKIILKEVSDRIRNLPLSKGETPPLVGRGI